MDMHWTSNRYTENRVEWNKKIYSPFLFHCIERTIQRKYYIKWVTFNARYVATIYLILRYLYNQLIKYLYSSLNQLSIQLSNQVSIHVYFGVQKRTNIDWWYKAIIYNVSFIELYSLLLLSCSTRRRYWVYHKVSFQLFNQVSYAFKCFSLRQYC